ncbi:hypothetical protein [Hufsiella ginkgonis]|uniref:Right-handed parallel beta-helix repeat-containing protein n=1 Tax=Hufsiella ginkgonis TaxID=2695274 RepID=A0A7K1Y030_9SPHI|nr:hypothetical protein [Hufsiella ginkgonis]MXV16408.1 hypothetical protein [Hufsiella ginkgonis]
MKKLTFFKGIATAIAMLISLVIVQSCKKENLPPPGSSGETVSSRKGTGTISASSAEVTKSGSNYIAKVNGVTKYTGTDYIAAIQAACNNLTSGRTAKEWVVVKNSGSSGNSGGSVKAVNLPSYTGIDFSNTTFTCNSNDLLIVPVQADRKTQIEVKNLQVSGNPRYGIWFKGCTNMAISNITMNLTNGSGQYGLGIRVDHSTAATSNLTISGTINITGGDMSIETYGLDGFSIGNVTSSNNFGCGVLLNQSKNGSVGTVTGNYNCNGGGYATFRVANNNGPNVTCAKVYSRNSGRGFFSVSGSNGTTVTTVDIANNTSHGIFLEDATNTKVNGGTVSGSHPNVQHVRTASCTTKVNGQTYTAANGSW